MIETLGRCIALSIFLSVLYITTAHSAQIDDQAACESKYNNLQISQEELNQIVETGSYYYKVPFLEPMKVSLCSSNLRDKNLVDANFIGGDLRNANLINTDLSHSWFSNANLFNANLNEAKLVGAHFINTNLRNVDMSSLGKVLLENTMEWVGSGADLTDAEFIEADLTHANLEDVMFDNTIFELKAGALPYVQTIALAHGLSKLTFKYSAHSLIELREAFKKAGLQEQERAVTCAINRSQTKQWKSGLRKCGHWILFDATCEYGMSPLRPLILLSFCILYFSPFYIFAMRDRRIRQSVISSWFRLHFRRSRIRRLFVLAKKRMMKGSVWRIWQQDRILNRFSQDRERMRIHSLPYRFFHGIYFSLLSAFHFGWRDINVGNWISRMQPKEYSYRATGWVRFVSGFQSLISIYLLALWVLTYFGKPFD